MSNEGFKGHVFVPFKHEAVEGEKKSMSSDETIQFLKEKSVKPLVDWQPHQPLLYVLPEDVRKEIYFSHVPPEEVPSIVRLYDVREIDLSTPTGGQRAIDAGLATYPLLNDGQTDYYSIDPETHLPLRVRSSHTVSHKSSPYYVVKENLFEVDDSLFPPQEPMPK